MKKGPDQLNVVGFLSPSPAKLSLWMHTAVNTDGEERFFNIEYRNMAGVMVQK